MIVLLILLILFVIVAIFAFPQFSPIPYFPSNKKDIKYIIKALKLKNNQTVYDLGAGDGVVIFEAAKESWRKNLNTQFIAIDINPILLVLMHIRRLFHPNRRNIRITYGNMFTMNYSSLTTDYSLPTTFYLYISPWHIEKTLRNIKKQIGHFFIVSYMYRIPGLQNIEKKIQGIAHDTYTYTV